MESYHFNEDPGSEAGMTPFIVNFTAKGWDIDYICKIQ